MVGAHRELGVDADVAHPGAHRCAQRRFAPADRNLLSAAIQPVAMHATAAAADERAQSVVGVHRLERQDAGGFV